MSVTTDPTIADKIVDFLKQYVYLPQEDQYRILALYVIHTHAIDCAKVTPYVYLNSAERGSGKSTLMEVLMPLTHNAISANNTTPAVVFRMIEKHAPTMFTDEVDAIWNGAKNEDLRGLINGGYKRGNKVWRAVGSPTDDNGGLMEFNTFCAKVMAGIDNGNMPETIQDRSIVFQLRRASADQMSNIEEFYADDAEDEIAELRSEIVEWIDRAREYITQSKINRPDRIAGMTPRANEIASPLLLIARYLGERWQGYAQDGLKALLTGNEKISPQTFMLIQIRDYMDTHKIDRVTSANIAELTGHSGKQIAVWMGAYGVKPGTYQIDGKPAKGYRRVDFTDAWSRYIPAGM